MQLPLFNHFNDKEQFNIKRRLNRKNKKIIDVPYPFLKWAGGKRQLLSQIDQYLPLLFNKYIEPFVGGGALFFYLLPENAILIDNNPVLINAYNVIKENVEELIELLSQHKNEKKYYYEWRNIDRTEEFKNWSNVEKASRTIYLNRCCYNGLYRVNSKGQFNTPFGFYKNPNYCNKENLRAVNKFLQNIKILHGSFEICLDYAEKDDLIYFDPPYVPLSKTANFTSYTKESFKKKSQIKLFNIFKKLDDIGCKLILSNSYNEFNLDLYKNYNIITLKARRVINSNAKKRGFIKEVLILNNF